MSGIVGLAGLIFILLATAILLYLIHRYEPKQLRELVAILNTKGGNIILLAFFSMAFFYSSMQMFYFGLNLIVDKKISPENAVLLMGIAFVTGSAFGGAFGALITMLSGEGRSAERQADKGRIAAPPPEPSAPQGP